MLVKGPERTPHRQATLLSRRLKRVCVLGHNTLRLAYFATSAIPVRVLKLEHLLRLSFRVVPSLVVAHTYVCQHDHTFVMVPAFASHGLAIEG